MIFCLFALALPVSGLEIQAPQVPSAAAEAMPEQTASFGQGLLELLEKGLYRIRPDLKEAVLVAAQVVILVLAVSVLSLFPAGAGKTAMLTGSLAVASVLFGGANAMILLAKDTVDRLSGYGKLLLPVMAGGLAAQGGVTSSAGLYLGTAFLDAFLSDLLSGVYVPLVYIYLALAAGSSACGEDILKKWKDLIRSGTVWSLKTLLTVFTTYMSITGVVSGATDAAALKATKVSISSLVPVVGGVLSEASEAVLISAGVLKNAAGMYGIFALLALALDPFLKIGVHYLIWKGVTLVCSLFGTKHLAALTEDFSSAMGLLLGMTGAACLLQLISTVCFMKGVAY